MLQKYFDHASSHATAHDVNASYQRIETRELESILQAEIEKLPYKCRQVFKLSREAFLSDKEIAAQLDISLNTVEQHKRKALRVLRTSLGNYFELALVLMMLKR